MEMDITSFPGKNESQEGDEGTAPEHAFELKSTTTGEPSSTTNSSSGVGVLNQFNEAHIEDMFSKGTMWHHLAKGNHIRGMYEPWNRNKDRLCVHQLLSSPHARAEAWKATPRWSRAFRSHSCQLSLYLC